MDEHAKTHGMSPAGDPKNQKDTINFKGALSGLRQFLATESPLKMMKMLFISHRKLCLF